MCVQTLEIKCKWVTFWSMGIIYFINAPMSTNLKANGTLLMQPVITPHCAMMKADNTPAHIPSRMTLSTHFGLQFMSELMLFTAKRHSVDVVTVPSSVLEWQKVYFLNSMPRSKFFFSFFSPPPPPTSTPLHSFNSNALSSARYTFKLS